MHRTVRALTTRDVAAVQAIVLPTWQTAAAVAQHAGVPARTAFAVLKRHANEWGLECRRLRIDGHNEISCWRKRQVAMVMGVAMPVVDEELLDMHLDEERAQVGFPS